MQVVLELSTKHTDEPVAWFPEPIDAKAVIGRVDHPLESIEKDLELPVVQHALENRLLHALTMGLTELGDSSEACSTGDRRRRHVVRDKNLH
jgi:hypothetical protein